MNILAIGAHFDDVELGCGGTIARHIAEGDTVTVYVATDSGYVDPNNKVIRSTETAQSEGRDAMRVLSVTNLRCGRFKTLELEFVDSLNLDIVNLVEENNIECVYTHWQGDVHHDHQALARASLHGCRHVPRMLMYRSNWYHSTLDFKGNFYVDISKYWNLKKMAIEAHKSELERTGRKWIEFFRNESVNAGQRIGVPRAEVFEIVKWLK
ncbi:MAG: PIG-L deacetylase family protein [Candidatus Electrothrix communis]|nr:MAG: PIG-L deacetylase family protein [Candidatus Electrothrix communis]